MAHTADNVARVNKTIRIALADDYSLQREGLKVLLAGFGDLKIVGEASDAFEALTMVRLHQPDVLLLQTTLPKKDGIDAIREMVEQQSELGIIILDRHMNPHHAFRIFRSGAKGFVPNSMGSGELAGAIRQVAGGKIFLPADYKEIFAEWFLRPEGDKTPEERLSNREFQVMVMLAEGATNHEIGGRLHISVKTVDTHRANLLRKLRLRNNADVTRFAIRHGFVSL